MLHKSKNSSLDHLHIYLGSHKMQVIWQCWLNRVSAPPTPRNRKHSFQGWIDKINDQELLSLDAKSSRRSSQRTTLWILTSECGLLILISKMAFLNCEVEKKQWSIPTISIALLSNPYYFYQRIFWKCAKNLIRKIWEWFYIT